MPAMSFTRAAVGVHEWTNHDREATAWASWPVSRAVQGRWPQQNETYSAATR